MREAAKARAIAAHGGGGGFDLRETRDQLADRNARFHTRERHAGASMDAGAEGEVPVRLPPYVEPIRIGELRGITIGGTDADMHIGAGLHWRAAEHGIARGAPVAELVGAFHAQEFFDCAVDQFGMRAQVRERIGMADQKINPVADEIGRGLVARVQKKDAIVDEFELP